MSVHGQGPLVEVDSIINMLFHRQEELDHLREIYKDYVKFS